ncbi:MAG TPA: DUF6265 family protein [Candidatus Polarisedimenticolia bacterium]|nr:DUF6265 family protein [Candidatus Polarisedimenticolia bacterium]
MSKRAAIPIVFCLMACPAAATAPSAATAAPAAATPAAAGEGGQAPARLRSLDWLLGSWVREGRRVAVHEVWTRLSDRTFEGESFSVSKEDGRKTPMEDLRLVEMGGDVFYVPKVAGNPYPVAFRLVAHKDGEALFENPGHDFPTRIGYRLEPDGTLLAFIEGPAEPGSPGGAARRIDFSFRRAGAPEGR